MRRGSVSSACVFIPDNLEPGKILGSAIYRPTILAIAGNYDDVNRLCTQVADRYGWGFVNINLRSYYAEGAKTMGFEIVEQLGWRYPRHVVSPVAGGTLLPRILRGFRELAEIGLVEGELPRIHAAQAAGCAPVVRALEAGLEHPELVRPDTIAKSIAIGNPADGYQVLKSVRSTGGSGAAVTDTQIVDAIQLLAETEGIFTEPAGGTTLAATVDLVRRGVIGPDESTVVCITGNGYKTTDVMAGRMADPVRLGRGFKEFEGWWSRVRRSPEAQLIWKPHGPSRLFRCGGDSSVRWQGPCWCCRSWRPAPCRPAQRTSLPSIPATRAFRSARLQPCRNRSRTDRTSRVSSSKTASRVTTIGSPAAITRCQRTRT